MPTDPDSTVEPWNTFDSQAKEAALRSEADGWDTSAPVDADPGDIPTVDVGPWFASGSAADLEAAATVLRDACERVGFHQLVGHGIATTAIDDAFDTARRFHALALDTKQTVLMDRPDHPLKGVGYLPVGERKLPRRAVGNRNEAFLLKGDRGVGLDQNQWPAEAAAPGFRADVERYAGAVTALARRLLPVYAVALDLDPDFFDEGFRHPFWRLRMTHYPPDDPSVDAALDIEDGADEDQRGYGIAPHVDTTFFTLLLQDSPGLTIYSAERDRWINVPVVPGAFVVNSGELLRQWSNDRFLSTRHFADGDGSRSRYSIPLFYNATADYPMTCLPSCWDEDNPPRYPPVSYRESQAAVQGE